MLERLPVYLETGQCLDWATKLIIHKYGETLFLLLVYLFNIDRDKLHRVISALLSEFLLRAFCLTDGKDCREPTRGQHGKNTDAYRPDLYERIQPKSKKVSKSL